MRAGTGGDEAGLWAGDLVGTCLFCCSNMLETGMLGRTMNTRHVQIVVFSKNLHPRLITCLFFM